MTYNDQLLSNFSCYNEVQQNTLTFYICVEDTKHRTIYEYHRVEIDATKIVSRSAFEFTPLPSKYPHKPEQCMAASPHCSSL